ncbi:RIP metalloprotease RseP [Candidatus Gottesmanbacteria bacterium]|nr:RIP metalloprotease RseP [Candidatus Gottesmanbacteria bacterium]
MLLTVLTFFLVLSILVFIHELGHFLAAKYFGVGVEEFGFGLPPRIIGKKIKGTMYSLNWLPIGGFVKLAGEDDDESQKVKGKRQKFGKFFWARSKKERAVILIAGVFMNFVLAVGITTFLIHQGVNEPAGRVHVEKVQPGTPAQKAGLEPGDIIQSFHTAKDLIDDTKKHAGQKVTLTVLRDGKELTLSLTPRKDPPPGEGAMGVVISDLEKKTYPLSEAPWKAIQINLERARDMLVSLGSTLWRLVTLQPLRAEVAGPIGIAQVTGEAVKFGFKAVLELMSILSLNLAVLNILPFPALDGGRLAFVFVEKLIGRKIRPAFERSTHQIGMIILFILILLVSLNDILRLARGG